MTNEERRQIVFDAYPGISWGNKVRKMSDVQILAIYFKLIAKGRV